MEKLLKTSCLTLLFPLLALPCQAASLTAAPDQETISYLKGLSIEDLLQTTITSVSKKSEALFSAAAAVTVITQEDIERSGARSVPEALRMVPGLAVASIDASRYAIGSRGFNEFFETKLLVLMDGRSMYTPLFSGVHWGTLDTVMEDIERIEVIRGPGATVWGANAVNGVINIITKKSADTLGALLSATIGSLQQPDISTRYGGRISEDTTYRLYAKGYNRATFDDLDGGDAHDGSESIRTGFRLDSRQSPRDTLSLQAEVYDGEADVESLLSGYTTPPFIRATDETEVFSGGHVLGTWEHQFSETSATLLQFYYDRAKHDQVVAVEERDTFDVEFKHHWTPTGRHDVVWGGGVRWSSDDIEGTYVTSFDPDSASTTLLNVFIQDDINLIEDLVWLTLGSKFEYNEYTDLEIQPSIRFRLQPTPQQLLWTAVSRAVRTPSRSERDITVNLATMQDAQGNVISSQLLGTDSFGSEELTAYELGYRWQMTDDICLDISTFYNDYDDLRDLPAGTPFVEMDPMPRMIIPVYFTNGVEGQSYGAEIQGSWQPTVKMKFTAAYSFIELDLGHKDSTTPSTVYNEDFAPTHQFQLISYLDLTETLSLDSELYYVSDLNNNEVDDYFRFDLQLGWQATDQLRLAIGAENLFDSSHQEYFDNQTNIVASEVPSQYWLKATYRF